MFLRSAKTQMIDADAALPGRPDPIVAPNQPHFVNGNTIGPDFPAHLELAVFGMGCFWGAERLFWNRKGVFSTAVGYAGGFSPNPTYEEVCSAKTGHTEVVLVAYDPAEVSYEDLLKIFWEEHDPTQGMRQGNDVGTQYRSAIYTYSDDQLAAAQSSKQMFEERLAGAGYGAVTTEIAAAGDFYYAESYHQQYLAKNPNGYCGIEGTGVSCPIGIQGV